MIVGEAFSYNNNLVSVTLNEGLKVIYNYAFYNCTALAKINIPNSCYQIGGVAFMNTSLEQIIIPSSITTINLNIVSNCSMKLVFGKNINKVSGGLLGLIQICYEGNSDDWEKIEFTGSSITPCYYSSTQKSGCWYYDSNNKVAFWE